MKNIFIGFGIAVFLFGVWFYDMPPQIQTVYKEIKTEIKMNAYDCVVAHPELFWKKNFKCPSKQPPPDFILCEETPCDCKGIYGEGYRDAIDDTGGQINISHRKTIERWKKVQ